MSTTIAQPAFTITEGTITTRHGWKLAIPIRHVAPGIEVVPGKKLDTLWKRGRALVQNGISIRFEAPRAAGRLKLEWRFYGRSLLVTQLRALQRLKRYHDNHPESAWAHLRDFGGMRHGDWARLRHWTLIEPKPLAPGQKPSEVRGWWRLTGLGHLWLRGAVKVPRRAAVFDGAFVGWMDAHDLIGPTEVDAEFSLDAITQGAA